MCYSPTIWTAWRRCRPQLQPILLAGGEHEFTARDFGHIGRVRALDLWQPDVTWCGGLTAVLRIDKLAQAHGIPLVPHRGGRGLGGCTFWRLATATIWPK